MDYIVWFKDLNKDSIPVAGGKGANLGEMVNAGLPVPGGFVVSAQTYKKFVEDEKINEDINEVLKDLDVEDNDKLQNAAETIQKIIKGTAIPEDVQEEIKQAYSQLPKSSEIIIAGTNQEPGQYVAVRSSATAEDLPGASFAGQQATFLNIKGATNLIDAVRSCWASLYTARAIYYRVKKGFKHEDVLICVIVQKMIDSDKSGVMFTINPVDNDKGKISIDSAWGLGEAIVGGQVTPDHFLIDKETMQIVDKRVSKKDFMYTRDVGTGDTTKVTLTDETGSKSSLTDHEALKLSEIGKKIEEHYGYPQDIEWAVDDNKIFILQSRPVTTMGDDKPQEKTEEKPEAAAPVIESGSDAIVKGFGASPGIGSGKVKLIEEVSELDKVQKGDVMVSKMTNPDMVPAMERAAAIVTNEGGVTCHAAIVSRELGIPCIVGTGNATQVLKEDQEVTVDARKGEVYSGIAEGTEQKGSPVLETAEKIPTKTKIYVNLGIPSKAKEVAALPVDGVGLMREEFIIATQVKEHPLAMIERGAGQEFVDKLADGIKEVAEAFNPRPVVLRLSDFKTNEYKDLKGGEKFEEHEDNPMLGWRGCSRYTSEKYQEAFKLELKAVKKVRDGGLKNVWVMLPFVRTVSDVTKVTELMKAEGLERGEDFKLWIMAEVPSVVVLADKFAPLVDGFSIGSNDLTQLTMGADRDSETLERLGYFNEQDEAVLRSIARLIKLGHKENITVSICGQAPSTKPEIIKFLVEKGINSISANADVAVQTMKIVAQEESKITLANDEQAEPAPQVAAPAPKPTPAPEQPAPAPVEPVPEAPTAPADENELQDLEDKLKNPESQEKEGIIDKIEDAVEEIGEKVTGLFHHKKKEEPEQAPQPEQEEQQ